jgi:leucyl aminopeptidase
VIFRAFARRRNQPCHCDDDMTVSFVSAEPSAHPTPLLAVPVVQDASRSDAAAALDATLGNALSRAAQQGDLDGRPDQSLLVYGEGGEGPTRVLALGIGRKESLDAETVRRYAARAVRGAEGRSLSELSVLLDDGGVLDPQVMAQAAAEGAALAAWSFRELKTDVGRKEDEPPVVQVDSVSMLGTADAEALARGVAAGVATARGQNFARSLQSRPGNVATPAHLASEAQRMAAEVGLGVRVLDRAALEAENMHALLAVSAGSVQEPRLIILEHAGGEEGDAPLVLVGKGLTFDAGGISIKPAKGMEDMKFDMSGGAAVIGAMRAIADLDVPLNVVGIVPSSENLPSGSALKPGDVIRTREGKTVEVINTDAEGRLILADALSFAQTLGPAAVVDCATLTGSCVIALGHAASGLMGTDQELMDELRDAGDRSGERCWQLPLLDDYRKQLESTTADFMNVGGRPAGTITAAWFLSEFVGDVPWAHVDVAGTAYGDGDKPYHRKGGYGVPARLLIEWVRSRAR